MIRISKPDLLIRNIVFTISESFNIFVRKDYTSPNC